GDRVRRVLERAPPAAQTLARFLELEVGLGDVGAGGAELGFAGGEVAADRADVEAGDGGGARHAVAEAVVHAVESAVDAGHEVDGLAREDDAEESRSRRDRLEGAAVRWRRRLWR